MASVLNIRDSHRILLLKPRSLLTLLIYYDASNISQTVTAFHGKGSDPIWNPVSSILPASPPDSTGNSTSSKFLVALEAQGQIRKSGLVSGAPLDFEVFNNSLTFAGSSKQLFIGDPPPANSLSPPSTSYSFANAGTTSSAAGRDVANEKERVKLVRDIET